MINELVGLNAGWRQTTLIMINQLNKFNEGWRLTRLIMINELNRFKGRLDTNELNND